MKKLAIATVTTLLLVSCNGKKESVSNADLELIGKKITITYPEMKATVTYKSDSILHWKTTDAK